MLYYLSYGEYMTSEAPYYLRRVSRSGPRTCGFESRKVAGRIHDEQKTSCALKLRPADCRDC